MYVNENWEKIGGGSVNLEGYATTTALADKADKADTVLTSTLSRGRVDNSTVGAGSFAFGINTTASGSYSHAEGGGTTASGSVSHAEGSDTTASGGGSHAEGILLKQAEIILMRKGNPRLRLEQLVMLKEMELKHLQMMRIQRAIKQLLLE